MSKLRGKQHWQRVDADIRRTADQVAATTKAERQVAVAEAQAARAARTPVDPGELAGAVAVQDRDGYWHDVARVNTKSVSVKPSYLYPFGHRLPLDRICGVRSGTSGEVLG